MEDTGFIRLKRWATNFQINCCLIPSFLLAISSSNCSEGEGPFSFNVANTSHSFGMSGADNRSYLLASFLQAFLYGIRDSVREALAYRMGAYKEYFSTACAHVPGPEHVGHRLRCFLTRNQRAWLHRCLEQSCYPGHVLSRGVYGNRSRRRYGWESGVWLNF